MQVLHLEGERWLVRDVAAGEAAAPRGTMRWIRAGGASNEDLHALGDALDLHHLALEDIRNPRQRPKVEDYGDFAFVVMRIPREGEEAPDWQQVGFFLGPDFVVSASQAPLPELDTVQERLVRKGLAHHRQTPAHVLHLLLDAVVDAWFPYMDGLEETVEDLEEAASEAPRQEVLSGIRDIKQQVSRIRKVGNPMREACTSLERGDHPGIGDDVRIYLRDVSDHMIRLVERLDHVKEMALIAQETWNATLANQQNQVMKRLTVVAALLLVPGLIAGLGGMNFERGFPGWGYWEVTGSIIAFVVVGFAVAWRRGWL